MQSQGVMFMNPINNQVVICGGGRLPNMQMNPTPEDRKNEYHPLCSSQNSEQIKQHINIGSRAIYRYLAAVLSCSSVVELQELLCLSSMKGNLPSALHRNLVVFMIFHTIKANSTTDCTRMSLDVSLSNRYRVIMSFKIYIYRCKGITSMKNIQQSILTEIP